MRPVLIIVPLYRNARLFDKLVDSLVRAAADIEAIKATLLLINDSPDDQDLAIALKRHLPRLRKVFPVELATNDANRGFLKSVNAGFETAVERGCDVILLNSDTIVFPGALPELRAVAYLDHMIGFVSPRSNNATICSLPQQSEYRQLPPQQAYAAFSFISHRLPRMRYVPTAVGFCLFIKCSILSEFGGFDEIYAHGYNEENDLIMRANRHGYRAALANHAFVYHLAEQSFALTAHTRDDRELVNRSILDQRYPEYRLAISRYFSSPDYAAEYLLGGLIAGAAGKLRIAFDCTHFGRLHSGTVEAAKQIIVRADESWSDRFDVALICTSDVFEFHNLDRLRNVVRVDAEEGPPFAAIIRIGQPLDWRDTFLLQRRAAIVILFMLDTIALDCAYLDDQDLQLLWQFTLSHADAIIYNSEFTRQQYHNRFSIPAGIIEITSPHSTILPEYCNGPPVQPTNGQHILVVGNQYQHKFVEPTVRRLLQQSTDAPIVVLGVGLEGAERLTSYPAGDLDAGLVEQLYRDASVVVFPSHYEGFGFPILHALAHRRPVIVRRIPVFEEIARAVGGNRNLHIADSTDELVQLATSVDLQWVDEPVPDHPDMGWHRSCSQIRKTVENAIAGVSYGRIVARLTSLVLIGHPVGSNVAPLSPMVTPLDAATELATDVGRRVIRRLLERPIMFGSMRIAWRVAQRLRRPWRH